MIKAVPWLVFLVFGYYLMGGLFGAKLGMIDDHEIPLFLGTNGVITLAEFPGVLANTEVGEWGNNLRFRPSYYTLRIVETMLWRDNATLWYFTRYILLVISMWMGWRIMSRYFPKILSYLFIFYTLTMPFWPDIISRLGPSEIYGLPALLGFVYGYVFNQPYLLLVSYVIGVGSKENLLFMFPLLLAWIWTTYKQNKLTKSLWLASVLATGYTIWILSAIVVATGRAGTDMYLTEISYLERITNTLMNIPNILSDRHLWIATIGFGYLAIQRFIFINKRINLQSIMLSLYILLTIFSQYVFYNNKLPSLTRYDFPALILFPVFNLVIIYMLLEYFKDKKYQVILKILLFSGLTLLMTGYIFRRGYVLQSNRVEQVTTKTQSFADRIKKIDDLAKTENEATYVFVSQRFIDFEPISSVARFLVARSVTNKFELKYTPEPKLTDPLGLHLEGRMVGVMNGDNKEELFSRFSSFSDPNENCYSITFGDASPLPACPELVRF